MVAMPCSRGEGVGVVRPNEGVVSGYRDSPVGHKGSGRCAESVTYMNGRSRVDVGLSVRVCLGEMMMYVVKQKPEDRFVSSFNRSIPRVSINVSGVFFSIREAFAVDFHGLFRGALFDVLRTLPRLSTINPSTHVSTPDKPSTNHPAVQPIHFF